MTPEEADKKALIDALYETAPGLGMEDWLSMGQRARKERLRRGWLGGIAALSSFALGLWAWQSPEVPSPVPRAEAAKPAIPELTDDELLDLVKGEHGAMLVDLGNGRQRLIVLGK